MVRQHPFHVQRLKHDDLVLINDASTDLVKMVVPDVGYLLMHSRQSATCLLSVLRPLLFPRYFLLHETKTTLKIAVWSNVLEHFPVAACRQRTDAEINANLRVPHRQRLDILLDQNASKELTSLVPANRGVLDLALKWTVKTEFDPFLELREVDTLVLHLDELRNGERLLPLPAMKAGKLRPPGEEVVVGGLKALE